MIEDVAIGWFEVSDNHIHDMPTEFSGAVGIFGGYIFNSTIAHNTLERLTYTGISVGWGWNQVTFAGGNEIVNNSIDGVLPELADGGNIYCQSHARGSVISGNWLQNDGHVYGMIYTDGASHIEVSDNVLNHGAAPAVFLHGGGCFKMGSIFYNDTGKPNLCCGAVPAGETNAPSFAHELDPEQPDATWPAAAQAIVDNAGRRTHRPALTHPLPAVEDNAQATSAPVCPGLNTTRFPPMGCAAPNACCKLNQQAWKCAEDKGCNVCPEVRHGPLLHLFA